MYFFECIWCLGFGRRKSANSRGSRINQLALKSQAADTMPDVEILHQSCSRGSSAVSIISDCDCGNVRETESFSTPPFFPGIRATQASANNENSDDGGLESRDSVTTLATTDSAGSLSSVFEVRYIPILLQILNYNSAVIYKL